MMALELHGDSGAKTLYIEFDNIKFNDIELIREKERETCLKNL